MIQVLKQRGTACGAWLAGAAALAFLPACASMPTAQRTEAIADINAAQQMGAENVPRAAMHLQMAKSGLDRGEVLMREGEKRQARRVLQRAQADAELAVALVREARFTADAERVLADIRDVRQQLGVEGEQIELDVDESGEGEAIEYEWQMEER